MSDLRRQHGASEVLFHHRFPTSTPNVQNACHPFSTKFDGFKHNYVLVHNGYLSNDDELKASHEAMGIKYVSEQPNGMFNDSEALLYDVALYLEGMQTKLKAEGAIAFVVIERDETGKAIKLHWARNSSSPLKLDTTDGGLTIASEGKGTDVPTDRLFTHIYGTKIYNSIELEVPTYAYTTSTYASRSFLDDYTYDGYHYRKSSADAYKDDYEYEAIEYDYDTSDGDHFVGIAGGPKKGQYEFKCHSKGEMCHYVSGNLLKGRKTTESKETAQVAEYIDTLLERNAQFTEGAIEEANEELEQRRTSLANFTELVNGLNDTDEVDSFIEASNHVDDLNNEITMIQRAIVFLEEQLAYEEQTYGLRTS